MHEVVFQALPEAVFAKTGSYNALPTKILLVGNDGCAGKAALALLKRTPAKVTSLPFAARDKLHAACKGQDVVIIVPPAAGAPANCATSGTEVLGITNDALDAATKNGVRRVVFASSASVLFGGNDLRSAPEGAPYPIAPLQPALGALAQAEQAVLSASSSHGNGTGMSTCVVRLATLYGPGDAYFLPNLAVAAKARRLKRVGGGSNAADFCYAGNAAHALVLAASSSGGGNGSSNGPEIYNITDGEPVPYWDFVTELLAGLGYGPPAGGLSLQAALFLASVLWFLSVLLRPLLGDWRPHLTSATALVSARQCTFDTARARQALGYRPLWIHKEGVAIAQRTAASSLRSPGAKVRFVGPLCASETALHTTAGNAWIVVDGRVYDVSSYVDAHPGGDAILRNAGGDSSEGMHGPQHPPQAMEILEELYIADYAAPVTK